MGLGQRAAIDSEILAENIDDPAVDGPPAGNHAVAVMDGVLHSEFNASVCYEKIELLERILVEKQFQPFPRRQLPFPVLGFDSPPASAHSGQFTSFGQFIQDHSHHLHAIRQSIQHRLHNVEFSRMKPSLATQAQWTKHNTANNTTQ